MINKKHAYSIVFLCMAASHENGSGQTSTTSILNYIKEYRRKASIFEVLFIVGVIV